MTEKKTTSPRTTTKASTTTRSTISTLDEVLANPQENKSEEDHPIMADNSVYNSYVADIDSVFLPFTEYASSKGIVGFLFFF